MDAPWPGAEAVLPGEWIIRVYDPEGRPRYWVVWRRKDDPVADRVQLEMSTLSLWSHAQEGK